MLAQLCSYSPGLLLARVLKLPPTLGLLSGGATGICGISAALAVSSTLPQNRDTERYTLLTAIGVAAFSTLAMVLCPLLVAALNLSAAEAGLFLGGSIHDVAQVLRPACVGSAPEPAVDPTIGRNWIYCFEDPTTNLNARPASRAGAPEETTMKRDDMQPGVELLQAFGDAWNRHDIDALMEFMDQDCAFHAVAGPDLMGRSFVGRDEVREGFMLAWKTCPDAAWLDADHFVHGDRGVTESTFCGTRADGTRIEARMVDVFTFRNGRIAIKNAFRKDRPPVLPR